MHRYRKKRLLQNHSCQMIMQKFISKWLPVMFIDVAWKVRMLVNVIRLIIRFSACYV